MCVRVCLWGKCVLLALVTVLIVIKFLSTFASFEFLVEIKEAHLAVRFTDLNKSERI